MSAKSSLDHRLRLSVYAAIAGILTVGLILGSCAGDSRPSTITFRGETYQGATTRGMDISGSDLTEIGTADSADEAGSRLADKVVYALAGVNPSSAVVMRLKPGEDENYIIYSVGPLEHTVAVCGYYEDPPADC